MLNNSNILANEVQNFSELTNSFKTLYKYNNHEPAINIHSDFKDYELKPYNEESLIAHEAGYDALITGYVFLKSLGLLNIFSTVNANKFEEKIQIFKNKVIINV